MKALFCYRIAAEAGVAENCETGEPAEAYVSRSLKNYYGEIINISEAAYLEKQDLGVQIVARLLEIDESMVDKISIEEYEAETGADDEDE